MPSDFSGIGGGGDMGGVNYDIPDPGGGYNDLTASYGDGGGGGGQYYDEESY